MVDSWEKRIARASMSAYDPKRTLKRDKQMVKKLKEERTKLREDIRKLTKNNERLVKLVEVMEERIKSLTEDVKKGYVYSYEKGGWIEKGSLEKGKIKLAPSQVNVDSINNQLAEILRMIERHRIKE